MSKSEKIEHKTNVNAVKIFIKTDVSRLLPIHQRENCR